MEELVAEVALFVVRLLLEVVVQVLFEVLFQAAFDVGLKTRPGRAVTSGLVGAGLGLGWGLHLASVPPPPVLVWVSLAAAVGLLVSLLGRPGGPARPSDGLWRWCSPRRGAGATSACSTSPCSTQRWQPVRSWAGWSTEVNAGGVGPAWPLCSPGEPIRTRRA